MPLWVSEFYEIFTKARSHDWFLPFPLKNPLHWKICGMCFEQFRWDWFHFSSTKQFLFNWRRTGPSWQYLPRWPINKILGRGHTIIHDLTENAFLAKLRELTSLQWWSHSHLVNHNRHSSTSTSTLQLQTGHRIKVYSRYSCLEMHKP